LKPKQTSIQSPWQNGTAERWIGNCRREILDHVIALNERHLLRVLGDYVRYYHQDRIHDSLDKDAPDGRVVERKPAVNGESGLHVASRWSAPSLRVGGCGARAAFELAAAAV
jgi:hypothetical protein